MPIYLDNNATTQVAPEVIEAMLPFYRELWGNPSSLHRFGTQVARHLDEARERVAALIGAPRPQDIVFTSGGTEANHLAIRGVIAASPLKCHVITSQVEHPSVINLCQQLEKEGHKVTYFPVDREGRLDPSSVEEALTPETALVSLMWANNETGVLFPIEKIAAILNRKAIPFHVDGVQAAGKIPIDLFRVPVSLLSLSAHKFHGPKGAGALYIRKGTRLKPLFIGGHQESGRRAGTENVVGIVGLGKAAELAAPNLKTKMKDVCDLRDWFESDVKQIIPDLQVNGALAPRLPNTSNIIFKRADGEALCLLLSEEGICVSTGSACSAGSLEPSHVIRAMGVPAGEARGVIRFSFSSFTTKDEISTLLERLPRLVKRLKG